MVRLAPVVFRSFSLLILSSFLAMAQTPPPAPQGAQAAGQPAQPARPPQPPGKITGRVLRADNGRPLTKAMVTLQPEGRFTDQSSVRVDANGVFEFPEVAPGRYRLTAQRNGYVSQSYGQRGGGPGVVLEVVSRQTVDKIQFSLERGGVISGTVVDDDNEPVEGVEVRAQRLRFLPGGTQRTVTAKSARTDDLGNFRLPGLAPGFYYVAAAGRGDGVNFSAMATGFSYAGNYYPGVAAREDAQRVQVTAGNETRRIDFSLRPARTYTIFGQVIDPAPSASRRNYMVGIAGGDFSFFSALVNEEGKFKLQGFEPGEHNVFASVMPQAGASADSGPSRGYTKVTITDSDAQIVVELGKSGEVSGEIKEESGAQLPARVFLSLRGADANTPSASTQISEGKFTIANIAEGEYLFSLNEPTNAFYLKSARCKGEEYTSKRLRVTLEPKIDDCNLVVAGDVAQLVATVTREGNPGGGSVVVLIPVEEDKRKNPRLTLTAQTAPDGTATLRGIVPGDYFVYALPPADDGGYYDLQFPERNQEGRTRVTLQPKDQQTLALKVITPK